LLFEADRELWTIYGGTKSPNDHAAHGAWDFGGCWWRWPSRTSKEMHHLFG